MHAWVTLILSLEGIETHKNHLELQSTIVYSSSVASVSTPVTLTTSSTGNGICFDSANSKLYLVIRDNDFIFSMSVSGSSATALSFSGKFTSD